MFSQLLDAVTDRDLQFSDIEVAGIGHSLGGLILRNLDMGPALHFSSITQICSPNAGAHWVDNLYKGRLAASILFGSAIVESIESPDLQLEMQQYDKPHVSSCKNVTNLVTTKQFTLWNPLSWYCSSGFAEPHDGFVPIAAMMADGIKVATYHSDHLGVILDPFAIRWATSIAMK